MPVNYKISHSVAKLCPTLCNPVDCSPPGSSVHGISQSRILEWIPIPFSRGSSWPRDQTCVSCLACGFFTTVPPGKPTKVILCHKSFTNTYNVHTESVVPSLSLLTSKGDHCWQFKSDLTDLFLCPWKHVDVFLWSDCYIPTELEALLFEKKD